MCVGGTEGASSALNLNDQFKKEHAIYTRSNG